MGQVGRERGPEQHGGLDQHADSLWERRRSFRVRIPARATLWHKGELGGYAVRDVSITGCSLCGGPLRAVGESVDVLLHLPHKPALALSATVRRIDDLSMGLSFERATPKAEDCIQDVVLEAIARARADNSHVAIVIEPRHEVRNTLVRTLRELGQHAIGVGTALDAVQLLVEEGERVDSAFIEAQSSSLPSLELLEFLAHNHPRVRRVLVGDPSDVQASVLAETTGEVHALLETPCEREAVRRVLQHIGCISFDALAS